MAPKWRRMYSISLCFFSCASLFSLSSWYDILRVPINLGSRVSAFFSWNLPSIKNNQFEWSDSNCVLPRKLVTTRGHKYSICFQYIQIECFRTTNYIQSGCIQIKCFWCHYSHSAGHVEINEFKCIEIK